MIEVERKEPPLLNLRTDMISDVAAVARFGRARFVFVFGRFVTARQHSLLLKPWSG